MDYEDLHLEKQLCHRLYKVTNAVTRLYRPVLYKLDLTYPQYLLMMALWEMKEGTVLELQKVTQIDSGSLSLILKKIESKKFIKIKASPEDKRKKIVSLTSKGDQLKEMAKEIPSSMSCKINTLSKKEITQLVSILDKMSAQLTEEST